MCSSKKKIALDSTSNCDDISNGSNNETVSNLEQPQNDDYGKEPGRKLRVNIYVNDGHISCYFHVPIHQKWICQFC